MIWMLRSGGGGADDVWVTDPWGRSLGPVAPTPAWTLRRLGGFLRRCLGAVLRVLVGLGGVVLADYLPEPLLPTVASVLLLGGAGFWVAWHREPAVVAIATAMATSSFLVWWDARATASPDNDFNNLWFAGAVLAFVVSGAVTAAGFGLGVLVRDRGP